ncbi:MAG: T9SS type A sorting domain-containing protein [Bacteroidales bacterium]
MIRSLLFIGVLSCLISGRSPAGANPRDTDGIRMIRGEMILEKNNNWVLDGVAILNTYLSVEELTMTNGSLLMIAPTGKLTAGTIREIQGSKHTASSTEHILAGWDFEDSQKRLEGNPYHSDSGIALNHDQSTFNLEGSDIGYLSFRGSYAARISNIRAGDHYHIRDISTLGHEHITISFRQYLADENQVSVRLEARPRPDSDWVHLKDITLSRSDWAVEEELPLPATFNDRENIMIRWQLQDDLNPGNAYIDDIVVKGQGIKGIIVRSTPEGTGSLITNTPGFRARIEQFIPRYEIAGRGWHLLSSPVEDQPIRPEFFPLDNEGPAYKAIDFYRWDETGGTLGIWRNIKASQFGPEVFKTGHAYLVAYGVPDEKQHDLYGDRPHTFSGVVNIEDVTTNDLSISNGGGWHLLGNPFPSAIFWDTDNPWPGAIQGTPQVYSEAESAYIPVVRGIIPPMNGFMIQTSEGDGEVTIPAESRMHSHQPWHKQQPGPTGEILLIAKDPEGGTAQRSHILFREDALPDLDRRDTRFLAGEAPAFYSIKGSNHLSLQTLPGIYDGLEIPFGFRKNNHSRFLISLETKPEENELSGYQIFLDDLAEGITHKLDEESVYEFTASSADDDTRFVLRFSKETETGTGDLTEAIMEARVWAGKQQLHIATGSVDAQVDILDINGRIWKRFGQAAGTTTSQPLEAFRPGVYIGRLQTPLKTETRKVVISQ